MTNCNYTTEILPSECIGDSLQTINANFASLDLNLCEQPTVVSTDDISLETLTTEQQNNELSISSKTSYVYQTSFESTIGTTEENYSLVDGTSVKTTRFPYTPSTLGVRPLATFSTVALTNNIPAVTLYWLASGVNATTVYATNSAVSDTQKGSIWFNGPVNSLLKDGNFLYVGGEFTQVNNAPSRKFALIDLNSGGLHPVLGYTGNYIGNPFEGGGDLGEVGSVNCIARQTVSSINFLIVGGSFESSSKGRGLCILNQTNGTYFTFYVNGTVNSVAVLNNDLYVGGDFDYINYGSASAPNITGLRVKAKGIAKINLATLLISPNSSIDQTFATNMNSVLASNAVINNITVYQSTVYVGGDFTVKNSTQIIARNFMVINSNGTQNPSWKFIFNGPVHSILADDNRSVGGKLFLYVGGKFSRFYTNAQFYNAPRLKDDENTRFYNAAAFSIENNLPTLNTDWKPIFNDTVVGLATHDQGENSYIYAYGNFTAVNNESVSYLACLEKAKSITFSAGTVVQLNTFLQSGPGSINNAFIRDRSTSSLFIGGAFTKVNNAVRYYLAKVNGYQESLTTVSLSSVVWDLGVQAASSGTPYTLNFTSNTIQRTSTVPNPYGLVTSTTFTVSDEIKKGIVKGQLYRFFVRRPGNAAIIGSLDATNDSFVFPVNVLGWKVDFN